MNEARSLGAGTPAACTKPLYLTQDNTAFALGYMHI
jgi:hypothetical protein